MGNNRKYKCVKCGNRFCLSPEDEELYSEGYTIGEPDCCDDCMGDRNDIDYDDFSDADPGL